MSKNSNTELKDQISSLRDDKQLLEAFLVQSAYIESIIRRLFKYKLSLEFSTGVSKELHERYGFIAIIVKFCLSAGWIEQKEYKRIKDYFEERNNIVHDLVAFKFNRKYLNKWLDHGEDIIRDHGSIERFISFVQTEHRKSEMSVVKQPIELTDREKDIFKKRYKGETLQQIAREYGLTRERIRQIQNRTIRKMEGLVKESVIKTREIAKIRAKKNVKANTFVAEVCKKQGISVNDIKGRSRKADLALVRHFIAYHLREDLDMSYPQIGKLLGNRDHTTIIHAHRRISEILSKENHG